MEFKYTTLRSEVKPQSLRVIYLWEIRDTDNFIVYRYVGKTERGARVRAGEYQQIVRQLLARNPNYSGRKVHQELAKATRKRLRIRFKVLCSVPVHRDIYSAEREFQRRYRCG